MIRRLTLTLIAALGVLIGAAAAWVALSVPRDLRAESLLKQARASLEQGQKDRAEQVLQQIIKNYPRTDAAAEASYALFRLQDQKNTELRGRVERLERGSAEQIRRLEEERKALDEQRVADREKAEELEKKLEDAAEPKSQISVRPSSRGRNN